MNKFLKVIFKIFWVLLIGLPTAILESIFILLCYISIIGTPYAKKHFAYLKLAFNYEGKEVASKYSFAPIKNTIYGISGGFVLSGIYYIIGVILTISIVGYPLASKLFKIVKYSCAPFGSEVVNYQEYSNNKNTSHDISLLTNRILESKNKVITIKHKNVIVIDYIKDILKKDDDKSNNSYISLYRKYFKIRQLVSFIPLMAILIVYYSYTNFGQIIIPLIVVIISLTLTIYVDVNYISKLNDLFCNKFSFLFDEFNEPNEKDKKLKGASYCHMIYFKLTQE